MILLLVFFTYFFANIKAKLKIGIVAVSMFVLGIGVFAYSVSQTGGMVFNRYNGEDALGREKASKFSGREQLAESEIQMFLEHFYKKKIQSFGADFSWPVDYARRPGGWEPIFRNGPAASGLPKRAGGPGVRGGGQGGVR